MSKWYESKKEEKIIEDEMKRIYKERGGCEFPSNLVISDVRSFNNKIKEVTMSEVCEKFGQEVKIVK